MKLVAINLVAMKLVAIIPKALPGLYGCQLTLLKTINEHSTNTQQEMSFVYKDFS
jgi:hypothetical protein